MNAGYECLPDHVGYELSLSVHSPGFHRTRFHYNKVLLLGVASPRWCQPSHKVTLGGHARSTNGRTGKTSPISAEPALCDPLVCQNLRGWNSPTLWLVPRFIPGKRVTATWRGMRSTASLFRTSMSWHPGSLHAQVLACMRAEPTLTVKNSSWYAPSDQIEN